MPSGIHRTVFLQWTHVTRADPLPMLMYPSCAKPKVGRLVHPPVAVKACLDHPPGEGDRGSARAMLAAARQQDPCSAPKGERPTKPQLLVVKIVAASFSLWSFVDYRAYNVCSDGFKIVYSPMH